MMNDVNQRIKVLTITDHICLSIICYYTLKELLLLGFEQITDR